MPVWFCGAKRIDRQEFFKEYSCHKRWPLVCACPRLRSSRCRQTNVESSSLYFWSIWEQHVFSFIIVHLQTKIYEVLKRASVHLPVFIHYSTGTTTNSASLVLKRVRIRCARRCCCKVFSGRRVYLRLYSPIIRLELPPCRGRDAEDVALLWVLAYARKQRRKNAVVLAAEVVDSLLWVERHSGTVTGLPPKERLQKRIHWSLQLLFCFPAGTVNFLLLKTWKYGQITFLCCKFGWRSNRHLWGSMCTACLFSPVEELQ